MGHPVYTICIIYSNIQYCYRIPINFEHLPTCIWLRIKQGIMWYILYLYLHVHVLFISLNNRLISIILIPFPLPTHHQSHNTPNIKQGESESQMCSLSLISFGEIIIYILPTFSHLYQANILFIFMLSNFWGNCQICLFYSNWQIKSAANIFISISTSSKNI